MAVHRRERPGRRFDIDQVRRRRVGESDSMIPFAAVMRRWLAPTCRERLVMRETLGHYVPAEVAATLLANGGRLEPREAEATILMCDIEGFAALTDSLGPRRGVDFLKAHFELVGGVVGGHRGGGARVPGGGVPAGVQLPPPDAPP